MRSPSDHARDREIAALAWPALGSLLAEPILLLVDSAMIGHLGAAPLAALALASTILSTIVGLAIFLAYATTSATSRLLGAGDRAGALRHGIDGMWLAACLGAALGVVLFLGSPTLVSWFNPAPAVATQAVGYLRYSAPGLLGMLVVLAGTGALRGLLDTRTPLVIATTGAVLNIPLNALGIYGLGLGVPGAGLGTAITQLLMGAGYCLIVARAARAAGVALTPHGSGLRSSLAGGSPLFIRTAALRACLLATTYAATYLGTTALAGYQIVGAVLSFVAFGLDALAIAAQALIGHAIGRGDLAAVRHTVSRCLVWGLRASICLGLVLLALSPWLAHLFTPDAAVRAATPWALAATALLLPLGAYVWVLDGVLIGAADGKYLATSSLVVVLLYLPGLAGLTLLARPLPPGPSLAVLWLALVGFNTAERAVASWVRVRGDKWHGLPAAPAPRG
ncbi:MATE family efflux transporter [Buchananella hordeovulneris]|uniref:MATE family efflux transporter n=1 Tax=Buchananella hordeovulneris TaxID=52770 RepID=UPI0026DAA08B|nr:MATE family efflux transporter [Buchananella hordeovulneris]MDO5079998.1 MATE family efflux transporter [Buchananella hordeovulneris]